MAMGRSSKKGQLRLRKGTLHALGERVEERDISIYQCNNNTTPKDNVLLSVPTHTHTQQNASSVTISRSFSIRPNFPLEQSHYIHTHEFVKPSALSFLSKVARILKHVVLTNLFFFIETCSLLMLTQTEVKKEKESKIQQKKGPPR